jgi:uncharacterized protein YgiM (DUF1202 family)
MRILTLMSLSALCILACAHQPEPVVIPDCTKEELSALEVNVKELQESLSQCEQQRSALKGTVSNLQIQLLEKEALITGLERSGLEQQKRFDDAIVEVVRAKAKLRSLESKADAASVIAETEIAIKALKNRVPGKREDMIEITKAEKLLEMSSQEFRRQNFGGALYLASQAKTQIRMGHLVLSSGKNIDILEGEVLFVQPLPLVVMKNSNLRSGPGINQKILAQLKEGDTVIGYSYKGDWVRIETADKTTGWIFQSLVGAP